MWYVVKDFFSVRIIPAWALLEYTTGDDQYYYAHAILSGPYTNKSDAARWIESHPYTCEGG